MILLCVDTSGTKGSLALARIEASEIIFSHQTAWTKKAMHSEIATVQLEALLLEAKVQLNELTHLAVNVGPGSFTGLRVGISMVKTLAYALNLPVLTVNSLECLAFSKTKSGESTFVAIKAVQNYFYAAAFENTEAGFKTIISPRSIDGSEIPALAKTHTNVLVESQTAGFTSENEAQDMIPLLVQSRLKGPFSDWKTVAPLYVRASEAEEKLRKGLLRPV